MAQHDYDIANQSFPAFRTDLNNVLGAINSSNSGTSRPSSAVAGTIWLDVTSATTPTLKYYDGADDISLATLDHSANTVNWLDSSVVADLVNDTSPQLGGNLDVQTNSIVTTSNRNVLLAPDGTGVVEIKGNNNAGILQLNCESNSHGIKLKSPPHSANASYTLTFPNNDGDADQVLSTDGSGNLSFASVNALSGSGIQNVSDDTSPSLGGDLDVNGNSFVSTSNGNINFTPNGTGKIVFNDLAYIPQQALTSSSNAVAWDVQAKPNAYHLTTENTTFSAPTNSVEGAFICVEINYNGSHTIAFNTVFEFAGSTAPTFTSTDGKTDILVFKYNGAIWQEVGRTLNLSES